MLNKPSSRLFDAPWRSCDVTVMMMVTYQGMLFPTWTGPGQTRTCGRREQGWCRIRWDSLAYRYTCWHAPLEKNGILIRVDSRFAPSQWETVLLCNDVSHWLGASLESALLMEWHKLQCAPLGWKGNPWEMDEVLHEAVFDELVRNLADVGSSHVLPYYWLVVDAHHPIV